MFAHVFLQFQGVAFALALASHSLWFALGVGYIVTNGIVWASDHSQDPLPIGIIYHINFLFAAFLGALIGVTAANAFRLPRLFYTETLVNGKITARSVALTILYLSLLMLAASINIVLGRLETGSGGMNPIGVSESFSNVFGGIATGLSALLVIASAVAAAYTEAEGGMSVKYVILVNLIPNLLYWIYDGIWFSDMTIAPWIPGVVFLASLIVGMGLFWLVVTYVPAPREGILLDEKLYRNRRNSVILTLVIGGTLFVLALATFIPIWVTGKSKV